jgi:pantoate--beta-alanine ligase
VGADLRSEPLATVEYVKVADLETLEELEQISGAALLAIAVRIGKARLIDNQVLAR